MKKHLCLLAVELIMASVAVSGCTSTAADKSLVPVKTAIQEMRRLGWRRIKVDDCVLRDGVWVVYLHQPKSGGGKSYVAVRVAPDGTVVDIFQNLE